MTIYVSARVDVRTIFPAVLVSCVMADAATRSLQAADVIDSAKAFVPQPVELAAIAKINPLILLLSVKA